MIKYIKLYCLPLFLALLLQFSVAVSLPNCQKNEKKNAPLLPTLPKFLGQLLLPVVGYRVGSAQRGVFCARSMKKKNYYLSVLKGSRNTLKREILKCTGKLSRNQNLTFSSDSKKAEVP